jgi:hypothetical protein
MDCHMFAIVVNPGRYQDRSHVSSHWRIETMIRSYRLAQALAFVVALAVVGCGGEAANPAASSSSAPTPPSGPGPDPVKNLPAAAKPAEAPKVEAAKPAEAPKVEAAKPAEAPKAEVKAAAPKLESPK